MGHVLAVLASALLIGLQWPYLPRPAGGRGEFEGAGSGR